MFSFLLHNDEQHARSFYHDRLGTNTGRLRATTSFLVNHQLDEVSRHFAHIIAGVKAQGKQIFDVKPVSFEWFSKRKAVSIRPLLVGTDAETTTLYQERLGTKQTVGEKALKTTHHHHHRFEQEKEREYLDLMWKMSPPSSGRPSGCTPGKGDASFAMPLLYLKTIILPRQARDKHRENSPKRLISAGYYNNEGKDNAIFATPFIYKCIIIFTKTGSGRTYIGKAPNKKVVAFPYLGTGNVPKEVRKRVFRDATFILKTIILPRQARDQHRENSKKRTDFCRVSVC